MNQEIENPIFISRPFPAATGIVDLQFEVLEVELGAGLGFVHSFADVR